MKILVTGGAGFIGSHLVDALIEKGHQVAVVDNLSTGKKENLNEQAEFYKTDIRDNEIEEVFKKVKPKAVFHLAAQISVRESIEKPAKNAKINVLGALNVIENFSRHGEGDKFVFTSTGGAIYGDADQVPTPEDFEAEPKSPYGITKLDIEKHLNFYNREHDLNTTCLRLANVYGSRQDSQGEAGVVAIFTDQMLAPKRAGSGSGLNGEQPTIFGDGEQTRDYVYVKDVVDAHLKALEASGGVYNVGTGKETSVNELFQELRELTDFEGEAKHGEARESEQQRSCLDNSKIKKELGWEPSFDLGQGLKETVAWFKEN